MLLKVCEGFRKERFVVVLEVGHWVRPVSCFKHVMDALASLHSEGCRNASDVMCIHFLRYRFGLTLVRPLDCLNYLSRNHLFVSNVGVTTEKV